MRVQAASHLDFYEVVDVIPGTGSYIKSLFTREEGFLKDISSSSQLVKWDNIMARCYFYNDAYRVTGALLLFRPSDKQYIIDRIEEARSKYGDTSPDSEYATFAKNHWDVFYQIEREIREKEMNKKFYTSYGELQLCEVRFQVNDIQLILNKIKHFEEFNFIDIKEIRRGKKKKRKIPQHRFDWITLGIEDELEAIRTRDTEDGIILTTQQLDIDGNQLGIEAIGNLYVDNSLCRIETKSLELAGFASRHLIERFGNALTFKRITKLKHDLKAQDNVKKKPREKTDLEQENPEIVEKIEEKYFLDTLDVKIPALNNLTPREARYDLIARPLLIDWLKGLENLLERRRQQGERVISIEKIKKALDIDW
jgi:hypothetical protein